MSIPATIYNSNNPDQVHSNTHVSSVAKAVIEKKWGSGQGLRCSKAKNEVLEALDSGALYRIISGESLLQGNERVSTLQQVITLIRMPPSQESCDEADPTRLPKKRSESEDE